MSDYPTQRLSVEAGNPRTDPSTKSRDYDAMSPYWSKIDAILGGIDAIHAAGEVYLTRFQEEIQTNDSAGRVYDPYKIRLARSPFTNIFEDISRNLSAKPFAKELTMKEDTPQQYKDLAENLDNQGRNLHVFAAEVFKAAVNYAITWIMVDYTRALPRADGLPLTKADESSQNLRPYWVHVYATRMLAVYSDYENGVEIITHARIYEPGITLNGYLEQPVQRVRVLDRQPLLYDDAGKPIQWGPPTYTVWELVVGSVSAATGMASTWEAVEQGTFVGIEKIPLIAFFTGERQPGSFIIKPPLQGLAAQQIEEYNLESGLQNTMDLTCFPMLVGSGVEPPEAGTKLAVGPRTIFYAPPTQAGGRPGDYKFIEPAATSVKVVMEKLEQCRTEMRDLGMQPLTQTNLTVITTGQVAVKANSSVQAWAIRFADALEQAWQLTASWMGDDSVDPEVVIYKDFAAYLDGGVGFAGVMQLRTNKDISGNAAVNAAIRYGYLPDDFDMDEDAKLLAEESQGLQAEQTINPLTGLPINMTPLQKGQQLPLAKPKPAINTSAQTTVQ
jgi:hypothetical protein